MAETLEKSTQDFLNIQPFSSEKPCSDADSGIQETGFSSIFRPS
jgi:hypothetical protein